MTKSALLIASSFAPVNSSSVHRTLAVCKQLDKCGWNVHVLTMPAGPDVKIDPQLIKRVPDSVNITHCNPWSIRNRKTVSNGKKTNKKSSVSPAKKNENYSYHLKQWLSWWMHIPDNRSGWMVPAVIKARKIIRQFDIDVIYATAPAWTCHAVGMFASKLTKKPFITDFRDPWVANPFRNYTYKAHKRADMLLEKMVLNQARSIICNTAAMQDEFISRYPDLAEKFLTINNGFDPEITERVLQNPENPRNGKCVFIHAGNFYGSRSPKPLLNAIKIASHIGDTGNSMQWYHAGPQTYDNLPLSNLINSEGVGGLVKTIGKLPHEEVLNKIHRADVAVAVGVNGPGADLQIPRKVFEYIALKKPILMTGETCRAVRKLPGVDNAKGIFLCENGIESIAKQIVLIVDLWKKRQLVSDIPGRENFSETNMAGKIFNVFETTLAR